MKLTLKPVSKVLSVLALLMSCAPRAHSTELNKTWTNQNSLLITGALKEKLKKPTTPKAGVGSALKFKPVGDSGVAKVLADALGSNPEEKSTLNSTFLQLKQAYETEVAKSGKSHDIAAAMTFFIAANVTAYGQTGEPSDKAGENLYVALQQSMSGIPEVTKMSNAEKQTLHDWLVIMGSFVLGGYVNAKDSGDEAGLKNFKELAAASLKLTLGVDASKIKFGATQLVIDSAPDKAAQGGSAQIVGVWSKASTPPRADNMLMINLGYSKGRYTFSANGTYSYKREDWGGFAKNMFWTTEESGSYSIQGDSLTISPKVSATTMRTPKGEVKEKKNNPLEKVTYKWKFHYFERLNETKLVIIPSKETKRDGTFTTNEVFPKAYLYSTGWIVLKFRY